MLTVFNVGQGDSCLLESDFGCIFDNAPLLIDCGLQKAKVSTKFSKPRISVMLTHSHQDHIGGFLNVLRTKVVKSIYIPYYMPEIMRITKFLGKYADPAKLGCIEWSKLAKVDWNKFDSAYLDKIKKFTIQELHLVKDGDTLCAHAKILNPPKDPRLHFPDFFGADEISIETALGGLREIGLDLPDEEILDYNPPQILNILSPDFNTEYPGLAREYVHCFFRSLYGRLRSTERVDFGYQITTHLELTSNQASIVMRYEDRDKNAWLFTGDADQRVFERIIKEGKHSLKAKYLKVPHHGSRENLSREILKEINPVVATVSHGNRKFGRSKDTHPHHEIMDLLDAHYRLKTHYTNDVIKSGKTVKKATMGPIDFIVTKDNKITLL
jgi:beta-lactamase superfamily II metal-dependent hydrolase